MPQIPKNTGIATPVSIANGGTGQSTALAANNVFATTVTGMSPGEVRNLSWTKAAGVITIAGANGTALSASNPGLVCMPSSNTPGQFVTLLVTSNVTFNDDDHASSDLTDWLFGVTTGVAWNNSMPIFIHALNKDDTDGGLVFGISRDPRRQAFTTADIGDKDAVSANNNQKSIFVAASITEADYNLAPAQLIGATTILKAAAANDWTITTPTVYLHGFGERSINNITATTYTMPVDQNGANSLKDYFTSANAPNWATPANISYKYELDRSGNVTILFETSGAGNAVNGGDVAATELVLPFSSSRTAFPTLGYVRFAGAVNVTVGNISNDADQVTFNTDAGGIYNNSFSDVNDDFHLTFTYKAF